MTPFASRWKTSLVRLYDRCFGVQDGRPWLVKYALFEDVWTNRTTVKNGRDCLQLIRRRIISALMTEKSRTAAPMSSAGIVVIRVIGETMTDGRLRLKTSSRQRERKKSGLAIQKSFYIRLNLQPIWRKEE